MVLVKVFTWQPLKAVEVLFSPVTSSFWALVGDNPVWAVLKNLLGKGSSYFLVDAG